MGREMDLTTGVSPTVQSPAPASQNARMPVVVAGALGVLVGAALTRWLMG